MYRYGTSMEEDGVYHVEEPSPESPEIVPAQGEEALLSTDKAATSSALEDVDTDRFGRRVELFLVVLYTIIVLLIFQGPLNIEPTNSPIPVQYLESTGDYIRNLSLDAEHKGETIPDWLLAVVAVLLPLLLQLILGHFLHRRHALTRIQDRHCTLCAYFSTFATNLMATECVKVYCGAMRPLFYHLCQPDEHYEVCLQQDGSLARDARKSFPSAHASMSFSTLMLLTLYLNQKCGTGSLVRTKDDNPHQQQQQESSYYKDIRRARGMSIFALLPMALALFISSTRIYDREHFQADVVGGAVLGFAIGYYMHANVWFYQSS